MASKKKLTIIVMAVFLLGGIIFAAETLKLDKEKTSKELKEEQKLKYEEDVKKVKCSSPSFQIYDLNVKPKCDINDMCYYTYGLQIEGHYEEIDYQRPLYYFENKTKSQVLGEIYNMFAEKFDSSCEAKKEKLKQDYTYEIKLK